MEQKTSKFQIFMMKGENRSDCCSVDEAKKMFATNFEEVKPRYLEDLLIKPEGESNEVFLGIFAWYQANGRELLD